MSKLLCNVLKFSVGGKMLQMSPSLVARLVPRSGKDFSLALLHVFHCYLQIIENIQTGGLTMADFCL